MNSEFSALYARFMKRTKIYNDHWIWMGAVNQVTYHGLVTYKNKLVYLHRLMFVLKNDLDYNDDFIACHIRDCPYKSCWNPDHIYKGTYATNMSDSVAMKTHHESKKTHCPRGHKYTEYRAKNGKRVCLECRRLRDRNRKRTTINGRRMTIPGTRVLS